MALTLDELKALYADKGATVRHEYETEGGRQYYEEPVQLGDGWTAWEKQPQIIGFEGDNEIREEIDPADKLGGFQRSEGGKNYYYDTTGKLIHVEKESSFWDDFGPMIMTAATMGGGAALLGNSLFGLTGNAAAGAGGALLGGANAAFTDQDILKGALLGGAASAGGMELGDTGFKVADAAKAYNFAQNPTLAGAANLASPYVGSVDLGDTGVSLNDVIKGVGTAQALGSGDERQIFNAITGLAKGSDANPLSQDERDQIAANREIARLNRIEDAVLNQPAYDDGTTAGINELINSMYPGVDAVGMSEGDLAKFLEANLGDIQGSADLETLLKSEGQPVTDKSQVVVTGDRPVGLGDFMLPETIGPASNTTNIGDQGEMVITGDRNGLSLNDFVSLNTPAGDVTDNYGLTDEGELIITDKREDAYVPSIRTKDIKSDITAITADQIDKLFPDADIDSILQAVTSGGTKTVTPTKTTTPSTTKTTTPGTTTTQQALINLGLNAPMPSQDPYANIKLMEELFGGDTGYKLRSLGAPKNLASADIDALARMLRG